MAHAVTVLHQAQFGLQSSSKYVSAFLTKKGDGGIQMSLMGEMGQLTVGLSCTNNTVTFYCGMVQMRGLKSGSHLMVTLDARGGPE